MPAPFRSWAAPDVSPEVVVVAKRQSLGAVVTNRVRDLVAPPVQPTSTPQPTQTVAPDDPSTEAPTTQGPLPESTPDASPAPSSITEPTNGPELPTPSSAPTAAPTPSSAPSVEPTAPTADAPRDGGVAGPLSTTAPLTLRGAFVWGPMLMLSLLTLLLRVKRRPRRAH